MILFTQYNSTLSAVAVSLPYLPEMSELNSRMPQNAYLS